MTFRVVRPKIIIIGLTFMSTALLIAVFLSINTFPWYHTLPLLIMAFGGFFYWFHYAVIRRIVIEESGLEYRTLFTRIHKSWEEIKFIGVGYYPLRQVGTPLWIYFTDDCESREVANSKAFLRIHCRKKIITEISKFYDREITGLHLVDE